jgi:hypothetical protein
MGLKTYKELKHLKTFKDRFNYLKLNGVVGESTFGFDRNINQSFYHSKLWKDVRDYVIVRDYGCDLGVEGYEIYSKLLIHHMNPIQVSDIINSEDWILDPEFLITTTYDTHNAIHYGNINLITTSPKERRSGDTKLW